MKQMKTNCLLSPLYHADFPFSYKTPSLKCLHFREAPYIPLIFTTNNKNGEVLVPEQTMEQWIIDNLFYQFWINGQRNYFLCEQLNIDKHWINC